jgi:ribosomal protein S18 acetylase RimI-like enzyme
MPLTIRAATAADARAIAQIHVDGWRYAYRGRMPDAVLDALSVDQRTETRRKDIETPRSPEHRTWVAERDGSIVAFAITGPTRDKDAPPGTAEIFAIYVDPARIGTGAGRELLAFILLDIRARGLAGPTLWVLDTNARARRFYEIAGFRTDGGEKTETFGGAALREVRYGFT